MSKRLIDANELISAMYYYEHNEGGLTAYDAQDIINKAPTIEAVPKDFHDKTCEAMAKRHTEEIANMVSVVRCKECKFWIGHISDDDGFDEGLDECRWRDSEAPDADDFCSYGERKTNAD